MVMTDGLRFGSMNLPLYKYVLGDEVVYDMVNTLNPRDSMKGGRTEVFQMHCHIADPRNQCLKYLDVNSLYPYKMSRVEFPMGHPEIRRGDASCKNLLDKLAN